MIPSDVASRLRLVLPDQPAATQASTSAGKLTDVLSDLIPGQRLMAEIQALLPNGAYRAMIAQRDVTLALPFSAKTGDALELEVVESDGKLTLAFIANRGAADQEGQTAESVSTRLSQTGKLIGDLLGKVGDQGKGAQATPLNGNRPLFSEFPKDAGQLAPILKEALTSSGMFYEAHQVRWAEGKLPTEALLQEPQGKFSATHPQSLPQAAGQSPAEIQQTRHGETPVAATANPDSGPLQKTLPQGSMPSDLTPLVRQQLDALASQNYVWQGQAWPGQHIHWEISQEPDRRPGREETAAHQWQTRLRLTLPGLGGIDAVMRLRAGGAIDVSLVADSDDSRQRLAAGGDALRKQLEDAGLSLTGLVVQSGKSTA